MPENKIAIEHAGSGDTNLTGALGTARIKLKECEKKDKYHDFARELKKLWNMKVTIISIVIGDFGTVTKILLSCCPVQDYKLWLV